MVRFTFFIAMLMVGFLTGCNSGQDRNAAVVKDTVARFENGRSLFRSNCLMCHQVPRRGAVDDFVFDRLFERLPPPPEDYFIRFIRDSKSLQSSGDKYALEIAKAWDSQYEHSFKDKISQQECEDIVVYVKVALRQK